MALVKPAGEIPKDAVIMDKTEATIYAWELVYNWKNTADVWALRYGGMVLGGVSAASGAIMNNYFRRKMKLANYGYLASVIPMTIMPGMLSMLFHRFFVSTDILMKQTNHCPICYEVRSAGIQVGLGVSYPIVLAPTAAFMLANRYNTYRVPDMREGFKVYFNFVRNVFRPFTGMLSVITLAQLAASSIITYYELKNTIVLKGKLMEIEQKIDTGEAQL